MAVEFLNAAEKIKQELVPAIVRNDMFTDVFRTIFSLPIIDGGFNIMLPEDRKEEYEGSKQLSNILTNNEVMDAEEQPARETSHMKKQKTT